MSEAGWKAFVTADGVGDWVVLHGGPTAVFATSSLLSAATLAAAIAELDGLEGSNVALTVTSGRLTVRLTRELWLLEDHHVAVARAISAVARAHGAVADRSQAQEVQVAIAARPQDLDLPFWRAVLGYAALADDNGLDPLGHSSTVWLQELSPDRPLRHAMHIDVSLAREHVVARVEAALAAGGTVADRSPNHWTLADRAGNKVDVTAWPDGYPDPSDPRA